MGLHTGKPDGGDRGPHSAETSEEAPYQPLGKQIRKASVQKGFLQTRGKRGYSPREVRTGGKSEMVDLFGVVSEKVKYQKHLWSVNGCFSILVLNCAHTRVIIVYVF